MSRFFFFINKILIIIASFAQFNNFWFILQGKLVMWDITEDVCRISNFNSHIVHSDAIIGIVGLNSWRVHSDQTFSRFSYPIIATGSTITVIYLDDKCKNTLIDYNYFRVASMDKTIAIWSSDSGTCMGKIQSYEHGPFSCFSVSLSEYKGFKTTREIYFIIILL